MLLICILFLSVLRILVVILPTLLQIAESFFRNVLANMEKVYLDRNPTAKFVLELVQSADDDRICYDHIAFRTFGVYIAFIYMAINIFNLLLQRCTEFYLFL